MSRYPKKLIEVALPLDAINDACLREKSIRHGHPSSLHLWWARRPLAAARAVLFAQLVNDPGGHRGWGSVRGQTKEQAKVERERLFGIIRKLVQWENTTNEEVLEQARSEIIKSWEETCAITGEDPSVMPPVLDPFAGGGSIPLEAQRLGMHARASDLNPIPVLINKALIEIPPLFAGRNPVGPTVAGETYVERSWPGASGLVEDVRRYGNWLKNEAWNRIGHLYPQVSLSRESGGGKATVIAWIWARTVRSPNPAYQEHEVPLCSSFVLSTKPGKEAWVVPIVTGNKYHFEVRTGGKPPKESSSGTKIGRGGNFSCLLSGSPIDDVHIKGQGKLGRLGIKLMAVIAEGPRQRYYLSPTREMEQLATAPKIDSGMSMKLNHDPRNIWCVNYGLETYESLYSPRQLVALTTFSDLISEVKNKVIANAVTAGWPDDNCGIASGGRGARAYGEAIATYLAFVVDQMANHSSTLCGWNSANSQMRCVFARQAIPMTWDFAEVNVFSESSGSFYSLFDRQLKGIATVCEMKRNAIASASTSDATAVETYRGNPIISTDPPYYDNIGYADLSDFFYVWLRRSLKDVYPDLFRTLLTPKAEELIAAPYRHGDKEKAHQFFMGGMRQALQHMAAAGHPAHPVTIYYAFKQSDTKDVGTASSGWEAFLQAVIDSGFMVTGTWPMRTEKKGRMISVDTNALASSIIMVCRARGKDAASVTRRQFIKDLADQLPLDLEDMINGTIGISPVAPVDLAQAAIGPGMAIFSQYASVIEADGSSMTVHQALLLVNKGIDDYFDAAEGRMDGLTRFCTRWLTSHGLSDGPYGEADGLSRACGVSVANHVESIESGKGKVRLRASSEHNCAILPDITDNPSIWTSLHRLAGRLEAGDTVTAGSYLARIPQHAADIRSLAYRLYTICERAKLNEAARTYNNVITSWDAIVYGSEQAGVVGKQQGIFDSDADNDDA